MAPSSHDLDAKRRIKDSTNIVDYIGREFQLRRQGATYVCHCPFHDDKRPSFQINPVRQSWACWVCNIRGDIYSYVMRRDNVDFRGALEHLSEFTGIPLTTRPRQYEKGSVDDKQWLYKAAEWAETEFHQCLLNNDAAAPARDYLNSRGIADESIDQFKIGFSPNLFTWLVDRAAKSPFKPKVLEAIGLIATSSRGSWYDRFKGRLIFPIRDTSQRPIAYGGRVVPGVFTEEEASKTGKYYNSPETILFSKSDTLYALNLARDEIKNHEVRKLTVVEGYTDVVGAWQNGMRNTVACLGTALNERHLKVLRRFADQVTLVLDGDDAGKKTANKVLDMFVSNDLDLRILTLPEGLDPFDYVMENGNGPFQAMLDSAPDAIEHRIRTETAGVDVLNDTHNANLALERILETLAQTSASWFSGSAAKRIRQDQLLSRLARKFNVETEQLRRRVAEIRSQSSSRFDSYVTGESASEEAKLNTAALDRKELELLQLMLKDQELVDIAIENVSPDQFSTGPVRDLFSAIIDLFHEGHEISYDELLLAIEHEHQLLRDLLFYMQDESDSRKVMAESNTEIAVSEKEQLDSIIAVFNNLNVESGNRALISELQQQQLDEQEEARKLEELLKQTRRRQGLSAPMDG